MAICLCHQNGRIEYWNVGILEITVEGNHFNCKKLLKTHHFYPVKLLSISPGPLLHDSIIPNREKPLSFIIWYPYQIYLINVTL